MAKVYLVTEAKVQAVGIDLDGATPIVPMRAVLVRTDFQTTDEWPDFLSLPGESALFFAVHPDLAKGLAHDLLDAAQDLDNE